MNQKSDARQLIVVEVFLIPNYMTSCTYPTELANHDLLTRIRGQGTGLR